MRTIDSKGKRVVSDFVNNMCGVDSGDVSYAEGQCECLVAAILVC